MITAIGVSKAGLVKQPPTLPFKFRDLTITGSLIFGVIATNENFVQLETLGKFYHTSLVVDSEPDSEVKASTYPTLQNVRVQVARVLLSVTQEEIFFRWIILSALLLAIRPTPAVAISSLLFAGIHMKIPLLSGNIEPGMLSILPTFMIGMFCGLAFLRHGLLGAIAVHFGLNICVTLRSLREYRLNPGKKPQVPR